MDGIKAFALAALVLWYLIAWQVAIYVIERQHRRRFQAS